MEKSDLPGIKVNTNEVPARGENIYIPIPESVEFRRLDRPPGRRLSATSRVAVAGKQLIGDAEFRGYGGCPAGR